MRILPRLGLGTRLLLAISTIALALTVVMAALSVSGLRSTLAGVGDQQRRASETIQRDQSQRLAAAQEQQIASSHAEIERKTTVLAKLLSSLTPTALATFDDDALNHSCAGIAEDTEVLLAYVTDPAGKVRSNHVGPKVAESVKTADVAQALAAFKGRKDVSIVSDDIVNNGKMIGHAIVIVTTARLLRETERIGGSFAAIQAATHSSFTTMDGDIAKVIDSAKATQTKALLVVGLLALLIAIGLAIVLSRSITRPMAEVGAVVQALAQGNLKRRALVSHRDEIGIMASGLNQTLDGLHGSVVTITGSAESLSEAANALSAVSGQLNDTANATAAQAQTVSVASVNVSENISSIAHGVSELGLSVAEIARSAQEAAGVAAEAVTLADGAGSTMQRLGLSGAEIGSVIKTISAIASQTNLLALNATIEAARAGEAGKGFAVVATEVKELARQTATATADISQKAAAIENDTKAAVDIITRIGAIIGRINALQQAIASAVEEQSVTTRQLNDNVAEVAKGSTDITANIGEVALSVRQSTNVSADTLHSAKALSQLAGELQHTVARFQL